MAQATPNIVSVCDGNSVSVGSNTYTTTGVYYDTLNASNFCDSVIYTDLTVNQADIATITTDPANGIICLGDAVTITASSNNRRYLWMSVKKWSKSKIG